MICHTCEGEWIILVKEKCSLTQIYKDLRTTFESHESFVYVEKISDVWVQLMKMGAKTKALRLEVHTVMTVVFKWT